MVPSKAPVVAWLLVVAAAAPANAAAGLKLIPEVDLLLVNFAVLLVLIYPVNRLLLQPLAAVLAEREARTSGALARAEHLVSETAGGRETLEAGLLAARIEAQARRTALLAEAEAEERRLLDEARDAGKHELGEVRKGIDRELDQARESLEGDARELAKEAASRILGRKL